MSSRLDTRTSRNATIAQLSQNPASIHFAARLGDGEIALYSPHVQTLTATPRYAFAAGEVRVDFPQSGAGPAPCRIPSTTESRQAPSAPTIHVIVPQPQMTAIMRGARHRRKCPENARFPRVQTPTDSWAAQAHACCSTAASEVALSIFTLAHYSPRPLPRPFLDGWGRVSCLLGGCVRFR